MNETQTETGIMTSTSGAASLTRGTVHCHNEGVGIDRANSDPSAEWWTTSDVAAYLGLRGAMLETCGSAGKGCTFPVIE